MIPSKTRKILSCQAAEVDKKPRSHPGSSCHILGQPSILTFDDVRYVHVLVSKSKFDIVF